MKKSIQSLYSSFFPSIPEYLISLSSPLFQGFRVINALRVASALATVNEEKEGRRRVKLAIPN